MGGRFIPLCLAVTLVAGTPAAVFAQRQAVAADFEWPIQQWRSAATALELPRSKTLPPARVVRRGGARSEAVALTFDDGYNRLACARIANILRREGAVGTFFVNGQWLQRAPNQWRRILEGMEVANHTRSHTDLTRVAHPIVIRQIVTNEAIHERVLGRPMTKVLRPPYGAYGERIGRIARSLGYDHVAMWTVDTRDWRPRAKVKGIVRRATAAAPGAIILMHCARNATAKALPAIIRHYQRRGIELARLSWVIRGAGREERRSKSGGR